MMKIRAILRMGILKRNWGSFHNFPEKSEPMIFTKSENHPTLVHAIKN
jgi:hypothetical protein